MRSFHEFWNASSEEDRHLLDERSAIHEFDGKLSRLEAEIRTVREYKQQRVKQCWQQLRLEAGLL